MHLVLVPAPLEELTVLEETGTATVPSVVLPTADIDLSQLLRLANGCPKGTLAVPEAVAPLTFVLLAARKDLHTIAMLLIVAPLAVVICTLGALVFQRAIFAHDALADPVDGAALPRLVGLGIILAPQRVRLGPLRPAPSVVGEGGVAVAAIVPGISGGLGRRRQLAHRHRGPGLPVSARRIAGSPQVGGKVGVEGKPEVEPAA
mmetsp:Transcript_15144/g.40073  ORF Transcript_15144/g.40073 Transcript_15144/m.40073 type:complete len:204 (+) Transcript_15144:839-1450(+)